VGSGARLAAIGIVCGSVAAWFAGAAMRSLLAGVDPADAPAFGAAIALCVLMTLSGCLLPALRAIRIDPATAVRQE
jgi:ABC-type antimicrobial peptide transport system permease subunit